MRLDHPHIVKLYDFYENEEYFVMIMEYCAGELFDYLALHGRLSEEEARHVLDQVTDALVYLHEEVGLVHRDLKFENLLFDYTQEYSIGNVKVADFGLSKLIHDQQTKTPCGTLGYSAPEIMRDEAYAKSVDMWSLGCILYTMLCGFAPFNGTSDQDLANNVARGWYTFPSPWWDEISDEAKDLVSNLLELDAEKRLSASQVQAHPWITGQKLDRAVKPCSMEAIWSIPETLKTPGDTKKTYSFGSRSNSFGSDDDKSPGSFYNDIFQSGLLTPGTTDKYTLDSTPPRQSKTPAQTTLQPQKHDKKQKKVQFSVEPNQLETLSTNFSLNLNDESSSLLSKRKSRKASLLAS